jgi:hypothetical protein
MLPQREGWPDDLPFNLRFYLGPSQSYNRICWRTCVAHKRETLLNLPSGCGPYTRERSPLASPQVLDGGAPNRVVFCGDFLRLKRVIFLNARVEPGKLVV